MSNLKTIKQLHKDDKPREKLAAKGAQSLKNDELLAILLGSGVQGKDVRKLAKEIISMLDSDFETLTLDKLCDIHGLGVAKASQILASIELSKNATSYKTINVSPLHRMSTTNSSLLVPKPRNISSSLL